MAAVLQGNTVLAVQQMETGDLAGEHAAATALDEQVDRIDILILKASVAVCTHST